MGMPVIQSAFIGWEIPITLLKVTTVLVEGDLVTTQSPINFLGTQQPLMPKKLIVSAQGQRYWSWLMIHTRFRLGSVIDDNDRINYNGKQFKVMLTNDYTLNGYLEYHLVEDYQ